MELSIHEGIAAPKNVLKLLFPDLKRVWNFARELSLQSTFGTLKNLNLKLEKWRHNEIIQFLLIMTLCFAGFVIFSVLCCQFFKIEPFIFLLRSYKLFKSYNCLKPRLTLDISIAVFWDKSANIS